MTTPVINAAGPDNAVGSEMSERVARFAPEIIAPPITLGWHEGLEDWVKQSVLFLRTPDELKRRHPAFVGQFEAHCESSWNAYEPRFPFPEPLVRQLLVALKEAGELGKITFDPATAPLHTILCAPDNRAGAALDSLSVGPGVHRAACGPHWTNTYQVRSGEIACTFDTHASLFTHPVSLTYLFERRDDGVEVVSKHLDVSPSLAQSLLGRPAIGPLPLPLRAGRSGSPADLPGEMRYISPFRNLNRVYCAGPLFNSAERRQVETVAHALENAGFETFLPHRDGIGFANVLPALTARGLGTREAEGLLHRAIFALDTYELAIRCGAAVLDISGRVPDEGTVAEGGMAFALGKPIVLFKSDDVRGVLGGNDNPILFGLGGFRSVTATEAVPAALSARIAEMSLDSSTRVACSPHIAQVLELGARIRANLDSGASGAAERSTRIAALLAEQVGG